MFAKLSRKGLLTLGLLLIFGPGCRTMNRSKPAEGTSLPPSLPLHEAYCQTYKKRSEQAPETPAAGAANGYGVFTATVQNVPAYMDYLKHAREVLPKYKGRAVMWGPNVMNLLEGQAGGYFFMILEFPSIQDFDKFYCSPEYQPKIIKERLDATRVVLSVAKEGDASSSGVDSSSKGEDVKGFILFNDVVTDAKAYSRYLDAATELAQASGGRRIFSGGSHTMIEGKAEDAPQNLTLFTFPSIEKLKEWYDSPAYQRLKAERLKASEVKFVIAKKGLAT